MDAANIERVIAIIGALVVGGSAGVALKNDWRTPGLENQVFKLMLGLLALGCVLALLAAVGILGKA
ncbi:MAG: hypothetical protein M3160_06520 [Candidatus Eremiobacteraeota bacterium]|nr:hypothetical protein [Candidatus Eremiobacteraeota bacterium]